MLLIIGYLISFLLFAAAVFLFINFIVKKDRGNKEPITALFIAMGFGFLALLIATLGNPLLVPKEFMESINNKDAVLSFSKILSGSLAVGLVEESAKCIPLAVFIYRKKYFNELTDGIIYFGIVALTFGVVEDFLYALEFGAGTGILRIIVSPYLHAGFTIFFGVALAYRKVLKKSWLVVILGYLMAVLSHGLYDFMAVGGAGVFGALGVFALSIALNIMLFVLFAKSQKIDESLGKSSIGANKFCKYCGKPNLKRLLHCTFCGKVA